MKTISFNNLPEAVGLLIEKIDRLERILSEQTTQSPSVAQPELMTVPQAAKFLNLAVPTVYSMVSRGEFPYMKRSKRLYFSKDDLMNYVREGRQQTNAEIMDSAIDGLTKSRRA
ncbi:MAG: helix-turn-helix domain-containing protein [Bacteroidales bacterium]|nr:helix-turn-helix domain-containing protein [Bacteroidales bacterium]